MVAVLLLLEGRGQVRVGGEVPRQVMNGYVVNALFHREQELEQSVAWYWPELRKMG